MVAAPCVWAPEEQEAWRLPDRLTPSGWATAHRVLSERETSEPGPWNGQRTPYLAEIMDACADRDIDEVTLIATPQIGKSELFRNVIGHAIAEDPRDTLIIFPDEEAVKKTLARKVYPLIRGESGLKRHLTGRKRDEKVESIILDRMTIQTGSAHSAQSLASDPYGLIFLDETGKYPPQTGGETDAIRLARHRGTTLGDRATLGITTTPTDEDELGWQAHEASGDRRLYYCPCPACDRRQTFDFHRLKWVKPAKVERVIRDAEAADEWDDIIEKLAALGVVVVEAQLEGDADEIIARLRMPDSDDQPGYAEWLEEKGTRRAWLECEGCGFRIFDHHRPKMLRAGEWLSHTQTIGPDGEVIGERPVARRRAYRIWSLYSPWVRMAQVAADWIRAQGNPTALMDFSNGRLAEPFKDQVSRVKPGVFEAKRDAMRSHVRMGTAPPAGVVPAWAGIVVITADTQKDHFFTVARAWGRGRRSKLLRYGRVETFEDLTALLDAWWPLESDFDLSIQGTRLLIDSGGTRDASTDDGSRTDQVYRFAHGDPRIIPTKGTGRLESPPYRLSNIKRGAGNLGLCLVNANHYKDVLSEVIKYGEGDPGAFEVHEGIDADYVRQMTAQHKVRGKSGMHKGRLVWVPVASGRPDHLWDCEVLQMVAADMLSVDVLPPLAVLEEQRRQLAQTQPKPKTGSRTPDGRKYLANKR
jgi:phage terminase large subunit GpA-like protein